MRPSTARAILLLLLALGVAVESWHAWDVVTDVTDGVPDVLPPFARDPASDVLRSVSPELEAVGVRPGARLLGVEGETFRGTGPIARALERKAPGSELRLTVRPGEHAASSDVSVRLAAEPGSASAGAIVRRLLLEVALPWFCMALGFWIALVHPLDRRARLLLWLLLSFGAIFGEPYAHWPSPIREIGAAWDSLLARSWPIAMMAAGLFFPEPHAVERRAPWLKWTLGAPLAIGGLGTTALTLTALDHVAAAGGLYTLLHPIELPLNLLGIAAVSCFFMLTGWRYAEPMAPDARRRLGLLQTGTSIALAPSFVLLLLGLVSGRSLVEVAPAWVTGLALAFMGLFPLTLAYVVVVERALDVRVVIREGLQYAFARRGIFVLRVVLIAGTVGFTFWRIATRPDMRRVDVVGALAVGMLLVVLLKRIGDATLRWTDRRFFREAVDAERVLGELADEVRTVVDRDALVDVIVRRIRDSLNVERVTVLLRGDPGFPAGLEVTRSPVRVKRGSDPALDAFGAEVVVPLPARDHLNGVVLLGPRKAEAPYSTADLRLLEWVGDRAGVALENARLTAAVAAEAAQRGRLAREVEIAREVQQRLFPQSVPAIPGIELAAHCRTALGVGGDYYDFLALPDGNLLFAIGDVSGKGIGAALVMASLQASLRGQSLRGSGDLARLMETVHGLVHDATPENRYATLFVGRYEPKARRLVYVNGGHNAPMILRAGGAVDRLQATGMVVGLVEETRFVEAETTLAPGDLFCGFSDGISEAMTRDDREFGEERLLAALRSADGLSPREVIDRLFAAADAFTAGAPQHDDMTVLVAKVIGDIPD